MPGKPGGVLYLGPQRKGVPIERWDSCPHAWRMGDRLPSRHLPVQEGAAGWLLPADGNGRG